MTRNEKSEVALEVLSSERSIKEMGIKAAELTAIRDRINIVIDELEKIEAHLGLYEVNGRQFREPVIGPASLELQSEIDIHNEHEGDNKTKRDYLVTEISD